MVIIRFSDGDDYDIEIFSVRSIACTWTSVILAGKPVSRRHSTTGFSENFVVTETSFQFAIILRPGQGLTSFNRNNRVNYSSEKNSKIKFSEVYIFWEYAKKPWSQISFSNLKVSNSCIPRNKHQSE